MEFAFNGLLRPEEDKSEGKGKFFGNSKQKTTKSPLDYNFYGANGNLFNVQKHFNYFQNPKN